MKSLNFKQVLVLTLLAVATISLSACETIEGAGRDIENAGESVQRAVN